MKPTTWNPVINNMQDKLYDAKRCSKLTKQENKFWKVDIKKKQGRSYMYQRWVIVGPLMRRSGREKRCISAASYINILLKHKWVQKHHLKQENVYNKSNGEGGEGKLYTLDAADDCHRCISRRRLISKSKTWYVSRYKSPWLCFIVSGSCK